MRDRLRTDDRLRSAIRFALGLVLVDAAVVSLFGADATAVIGSFAAIIHLYFLDFDGTWRERLLGHGVAAAVGAAAVALGVLAAPTGLMAIALAFAVALAFSVARVLRGYVARAVVGLTAAFFWPVMLPAERADLGAYVAAWLLGSAIALAVALVVLPHRRDGQVCAALAEWLRSAAAFARALARPGDLAGSADVLAVAHARLAGELARPAASLGSVGRRQRATGEMASRALWSQPLVASLSPDACAADAALAEATAAALEGAADLVGGPAADAALPDLEGLRAAQLERLDRAGAGEVERAYPLRLASLVASLELWLAAVGRGISAPRPDVGDVDEESPSAILRAALAPRSVWLRAALMTGAGAAVSVALVRALGLEHGLWVVLAALLAFQGSFSATAGRRLLVSTAAGAAGGVAIAAALFALDAPRAAFILLLPLAACAAKYAQGSRPWTAQLLFTPFVLVNLVVLDATPGMGLAVNRLENVALGAAVAAALTLAVFPFGIGRLLAERGARALRLASAYGAHEIARAQGRAAAAPDGRRGAVRAIAEFEASLAAGHLAARSPDARLAELDRTRALARERLLAGDVCAFHADRPGGAATAAAIATWWERALRDAR